VRNGNTGEVTLLDKNCGAGCGVLIPDINSVPSLSLSLRTVSMEDRLRMVEQLRKRRLSCLLALISASLVEVEHVRAC